MTAQKVSFRVWVKNLRPELRFFFPGALGSETKIESGSISWQQHASGPWLCWPSCQKLSFEVSWWRMRARRSERSLLRYWLRAGRLKESVLVVRFRILSRILDRRELLGLLEPVLEMMRSDTVEFDTLGTQEDFR